MKKQLVFSAVFAIVIVPVFCAGEATVAFDFGDGFRMSAPETVTNGIPVNWSCLGPAGHSSRVRLVCRATQNIGTGRSSCPA